MASYYIKLPWVVIIGGGNVDSVNGQTGIVVLTKSNLGLGAVDNTSDSSKPVSTAQAMAIAAVQSDLDIHESSNANPHGVTKTQVGLGNVNNTADLSKPISTSMQSALDLKASAIHTHSLSDITQSGAVLNDVVTWNGSAWAPAISSGGSGNIDGGSANSLFDNTMNIDAGGA